MSEAAATHATPIVERLVSCVSDFSARHVHYLTRFEENHESLRRKMSELHDHRRDVERMVEADEGSQQMQRRDVVAQWLERVRLFEPEVDAVLQECSREMGQRCCADYCPKNWWSRYKLGKKVSKKLEIVVKEISDGQFEAVADKAPPRRVEVKNEKNQIIGRNEAFSEVWSWLENDAVKTLGIYGMGGVGKTTLLKKINNEFENKEVDSFNFVIWVTVSSQFSLQNIQNQIGKRLGLTWSDDEDQNDKAQRISDALHKKKFALLLDDVWEAIDFDKIAIPLQNHHSKVVFTTRSEAICREMGADQRFRVSILEQQQAWDLFQQKVGQEVLNSHPEIRRLAKEVARECGGIPLALITTARAMSSKMSVPEWNHALNTLKKYASEFKGMEKNVFSVLKLSYDNLEDDIARDCFLYFSLYPEDDEININDIIRLWIGEEFLGKYKDMDDALNKGYHIIQYLKASCFLETGTLGDTYVKIHDVIRDLGLWITSDCGRKENKHLVQAGVGLSQVGDIEGWRDAERISLMDNDLKKLTGVPECPHLVTLMLQQNVRLSVISDDFFCDMPILRVLDLSNTKIKVVPKSIGGLFRLQFLNLEMTDIKELPEELGKLVNLKYLNLRYTDIEIIPHGMISCFPKMQLLDLGDTKLDDSLAAELESLEHLRELGIRTEIPTPFSQRLTSCITSLEIGNCVGLTELSMFSSSSLIMGTRKLRYMGIRNCSELETFDMNSLEVDAGVTGPLFTLEELYLSCLPKLNNICWAETAVHLHFKHLATVTVGDCPRLKDISWLVSIPLLLELDVYNCEELEEIIVDRFTTKIDRNQDIFSRLKTLNLGPLPKLKSIFTATLQFRRLEEINVRNCPRLKKLPLASNSTNKSKLVISGSTEWWNELQWEDHIVKSSFQPVFVPIQEIKAEDEESESEDVRGFEEEEEECESEDERILEDVRKEAYDFMQAGVLRDNEVHAYLKRAKPSDKSASAEQQTKRRFDKSESSSAPLPADEVIFDDEELTNDPDRLREILLKYKADNIALRAQGKRPM